MSNETDLAWVAGFIDGEGCITIRKWMAPGSVNYSHQLDIHLMNTNEAALAKILKVLGVGTIYPVKANSARLGAKPAWQYVLYSNQAEIALRKILPFLIVKRRDAEIALEFASIPKESYGRGGVPDHIMQQREELFLRIREGRTKNKSK